VKNRMGARAVGWCRSLGYHPNDDPDHRRDPGEGYQYGKADQGNCHKSSFEFCVPRRHQPQHSGFFIAARLIIGALNESPSSI
jgi:hypothetical protein